MAHPFFDEVRDLVSSNTRMKFGIEEDHQRINRRKTNEKKSFEKIASISVSVFFFVFCNNSMDFITGNDCSEWQILGDEDRSVLYQQVTVHEPMGWSGLSLECYKAACAKFSGTIFSFMQI